MKQKLATRLVVAACLAGILAISALPVSGQPVATPTPPPSASAQRSAADLQSLAAPIALYPDPLIATLLPASVYPLEFVQAARFVANTNNWPLPIPMVQRERRWFFETAAGEVELLNRRIGRNELAVLQVMRAYVDAQRECASKDRDADEVLEYAQKFASSEGKTDGLYWPTELNDGVSPLGPMVAEAQGASCFGEPYRTKARPQPFRGSLFKILTRQGKHAPGGKYNYLINGNMIGGFALVACPADYGDSGLMIFIVNQHGRLPEGLGRKDPKTGRCDEELRTGRKLGALAGRNPP